VYVVVLNQGTRKARKEHQCFHCYRPIARGETYEFSTNKCDHVYTLATHLDCQKAAIYYMYHVVQYSYLGWDEGYPPLLDQIMEMDGQRNIDTLRGRFPHVACRLEFHAQMRKTQ